MDPSSPRPHPGRDVREGDLLGRRYRLGRVLGRGGTASVHAATDEVLRREVAVKVLAPGLGTGAARQDEALLLASVSHPHLVTLHDADLDGEPPYLVMELVAGPSLAEQLREGGPLTPDQVRSLAVQLGSALAQIHARGMIHRDLKPANVLLAAPLADGDLPDARLTDFGIARLTDAARLTETGTVLGTAAYLSPEQARGGAVGPQSDVYSLGLVLLEAVTGEVAYPGPAVESAAARLARPPVVPTTLPAPLPALLSAMTASDPARRPTAQQVAALDPGADPDGATAPLAPAVTPAATPTVTDLVGRAADPTPPRRHGGLLVAGVALVTLVAALTAGIALFPRAGSGATPGRATTPSATPSTTPSATASPSVVRGPTGSPTPSSTPTTLPTTPRASTPVAPVVTTTPVAPAGPGTGGGNSGPGNGGGNGNGGNGNGGGQGGGHGKKGKG